MNRSYDFDGALWRVIPSAAVSAYDLRYTNHQAAGRWHDRDGVGCLYASRSERGALAEFNRRREQEYLPVDRHDLVQIRMKVLNVMDLTDPRERSKRPIREENMTGTAGQDYEACRRMGTIARSQGCQAIRSPCEPAPAEHNLNIFVDDVPQRDPVSDHLRSR